MAGNRIGIVGSGPTAIYLLKHLLDSEGPWEITVFEAEDTAGRGMPYREGTNGDYMLCNAFSREIPELTQSFYDWLKGRPERELSEWELSHHDLSPRAFYPRVLLGEYLQSEFERLCAQAERSGHRVHVRTGARVTDVIPADGTATLAVDAGAGARRVEADCVVLATGHDWPDPPRLGDVRLLSPWPHGNVTALPPGPIGVLGASLSAVDVVLALGHAHGRFEEDAGGVSWAPDPGAEGLRVTMLSHMGVMPEGDFYYPYPYEPLEHITEDAVRAEVERGPEGLLDRVFELLVREIEGVEPGFLDGLAADARTIPGFAKGYFERRRTLGGLEAVREAFAEARASVRRKETIHHRYALLRGHEKFDLALRHFDDGDWERFGDHLMQVFGDCYAAMPHLSLARLLAMDAAGVLSLLATGYDAEFRQTADGGVEVALEDGRWRFAALVDARGQPSAPLEALPFPSLVAAMGDEAGRALAAPFRLQVPQAPASRIYCLAMPQLLERHPFSQGLANCAALARVVAGDLGAGDRRCAPAA